MLGVMVMGLGGRALTLQELGRREAEVERVGRSKGRHPPVLSTISLRWVLLTLFVAGTAHMGFTAQSDSGGCAASSHEEQKE